MNSLKSVAVAMSGCLLAVAAVAAGDRGATPIYNRQGQKVGWYDGSYALLIGVSDYTAGWEDLESIPRELVEVRETLKTHGFEVTMAPADPTAEQLERAVRGFIDDHGYGEHHRLLIFFSGHGYSFQGDDRGFLVPSDAPLPREDATGFQRKSVLMSDVIAWARRIQSRHVLFVFDSCFSGTIFKQRSAPEVPPDVEAAMRDPVRQFITAGSASEAVPGKSIFTPHFTRALRGEADRDDDGYVTGTELGQYLRKSVLAYPVGQTPQVGKILDPDFNAGDFVFRLPGGATKPGGTAKPTELTGRQIYTLPPPPPALSRSVTPSASSGRVIEDSGFMWTARDNGADVDWKAADGYCSNLRLAGATDWRLPSRDELLGVYDPNAESSCRGTPCHPGLGIGLSSARIWTGDRDGGTRAWGVDFSTGAKRRFERRSPQGRALCVRYAG